MEFRLASAHVGEQSRPVEVYVVAASSASSIDSRSDAIPSLRAAAGNLSPKAAAELVREHLDPTDMRAFARSSPARLIFIGAITIVLCLAAGVVTAAAVSDRQHTLNTVLDETEPFASSAQRLYSSLSIADASAATAFISGGLEPQSVRNSYTQAVGQAAAELAGGAAMIDRRVSGDPDARSRQLSTGIATQLPVYAGLVETARANNRSGHPVGAAYLGEASTLMQTKMLPMAEELHALQSATVVATQRQYVAPPWLAGGLVALAVAGLLVAQVLLFRRWRRILNPGLIFASAAMVALFVWLALAGSISAAATRHALDHGSLPLERLTESRILAQQARSDETLKLVRRDTTGEYDAAFDSNIQRLSDMLHDYGQGNQGSARVNDALAARAAWLAAHARMNETLATGDYEGASIVAIGPGDADSSAQFTKLDNAIERGITDTRNDLRSNVSRAASVLDALSPGAIALSIVASLWIALGLWTRLREYR